MSKADQYNLNRAKKTQFVFFKLEFKCKNMLFCVKVIGQANRHDRMYACPLP